MKHEETLHHSEELSRFFAPRREEAPLLSSNEIESLLVNPKERVMPKQPSHTLRNTIMTITGLAAITIAGYIALAPTPKPPNPNHPVQATNVSHENRVVKTVTEAKPTPPQKPEVPPAITRGPWSAPGDQFYADLTPEELAKLGIRIVGDTVFAYRLFEHDSVAGAMLYTTTIPGVKYKGHGISSGELKASAPEGIIARRFYPHLMTFANGMGAAYRIEEGKDREFGLTTQDDVMKDVRAWLSKPGTPGYYAIGYEHSYSFSGDDKNSRRDSIKIIIGKDLPLPRFMPLMTPPVNGYPDSIAKALRELTLYFDGSRKEKPKITWPASLCIKVDTVTAKDMLDQIDREENTATIQKLHSIMAHVNELVPIIVRMTPGHGKPIDGDYIFWYEPTDELLNALPEKQAEVFRNQKAPQCLNAPQAVTSEAEVTYCVMEAQEVQVRVMDLMGHTVMSVRQHAESGDNIAKINTESLQSGMYIIVVQDKDGSQRSRRVWVQNAIPK